MMRKVSHPLAMLFLTSFFLKMSVAGEIDFTHPTSPSSLQDVATFITKNSGSKNLPVFVPLNQVVSAPKQTQSSEKFIKGLPDSKFVQDALKDISEVAHFSGALASLDTKYRTIIARDVYQFSDLSNVAVSEGIPTVEEATPVIGFFESLGEEGLSFLFRASVDERFTPSARANAQRAIIHIKHIQNRNQLPTVYRVYADEYENRAVRLRLLKTSLPDTVDQQVSLPASPIHQSSADQKLKSWEMSLKLIADSSTEAQVLTAIGEAQKLRAISIAPDLCDKLDATPPKVDAGSVWAANPKGRQSPAIAKASEEAIRSMGKDALPALLDAVSTLGRTPEYRQKAMSIIVAAAGDNATASSALDEAAKVNDERAARLRTIIARYNKPTTQSSRS